MAAGPKPEAAAVETINKDVVEDSDVTKKRDKAVGLEKAEEQPVHNPEEALLTEESPLLPKGES